MKSGLAYWYANFREGAGQLVTHFKNAPSRFLASPPKEKTKRLASGALMLGACFMGTVLPAHAALVTGTELFAAQLMGFGAYGVALAIGRMKENRHILALQPVVGTTIAAQKVLLGGLGYGIMAGIAATRAVTLSMIPEHKAGLRRGIAPGFWGAGVAAIGTAAFLTSPWNAAPILSMTLGTFADTVKSENTRYARVMRMIANTNNFLYSALFSHAASAIYMDSMATVNLGKAIAQHDLPKEPEDAEGSVGFKGRFKLYLSNMLHFKPVPSVYPAEPITQSTEKPNLSVVGTQIQRSQPPSKLDQVVGLKTAFNKGADDQDIGFPPPPSQSSPTEQKPRSP